jgi:mRNA (2'-O-methyladenosine-N6-)-methyltransferase
MPTSPAAICDLVHFRPLIRPHTDASLGHCSYLNTCYSEPTYAHSPSIPPFPGSAHAQGHVGLNVNNMRGPVSLPSGLGAGGRGKEKAPCRYLHYEVDWDGGDGDYDSQRARGPKEVPKKRPYKLGIGMGPDAVFKPPVSDFCT